jgi:hypothetical protein
MNRTIRRALLVLMVASLPLATINPRAGSPPNLLDYNGGPVLANPAVHNLYMDGAWDSHHPAAIDRASIDSFTTSLVSSNYFARASQYGVGAASFTGSSQASILCPTPIVAGVTDFLSIGAWMQCMTSPDPLLPFAPPLTGIPAPDGNTVYALYVPSGTQINDVAAKSCGDFGAYHFFGSALVWTLVLTPLPIPTLVPQSFAYTVVPIDCTHVAGASPTIDGISTAATHEIIEASTDPIILSGWINNSTAGLNANILTMGEAADICDDKQAAPVRLATGVLVSAYWSNRDNGCVPTPAPTSGVTAEGVVWRPSTGTWFFAANGAQQQWGQSGDIPVRGLYDADRLADIAVWRPSNGVWWVINSSTGTATTQQWGQNGDIPVPTDYDGDGRTDVAVWRPSTGVWWIINSSTGNATTRQWGLSGDVPVPADYDGDGRTDFAVWRPSTGVWWIISSMTGNATTKQWGLNGDIPVPADYDHDGKRDLAVWRPSTGVWWIINSSTGNATTQQWGQSGDIPVPGDYDHDGRVDLAVWRPSTGTWFIILSSTGQAVSFQWGMPGDVPIRPASTLP